MWGNLTGMTDKLYQFSPQYKETLWGGRRLLPFKGLPADSRAIGESWEVSAVPGHESVVCGGPCDGLSLTQLCARYGASLVGKENFSRFGTAFPLLVKFIDAARPLSVQVHPGDEVALRRHGCSGKAEMWYVVDSASGSYLLNGFSRDVTPQEYEARVSSQTLPEVLRQVNVRPGDVFFLPPGRVHSIGPGCLICEIQQSSDVTYRIYDFGRTDADGRPRTLHLEEARDVIDYSAGEPLRQPVVVDNEPFTVASSPYFTTAVYHLTEPMMCDYSELDSFVLLVCTDGACRITCDARTVSLRAGQTILVAAEAEMLAVETETPRVTLIESYV